MSIYLQSADGNLFEVDLEAVKCCGTIKENLKMFESTTDQPLIYLDKVNSHVLKKVLEWTSQCKHNANTATAERHDSTDKGNVIAEFDTAFLAKQNPSDLFELIVAANYLDIKRLLDITTQKVAIMIKGQTVEQIRTAFNLQNDFSKEEYEQILREIEWCEQK